MNVKRYFRVLGVELWHGSSAWELDVWRWAIYVPYRSKRALACYAGRRVKITGR